MSQKKYRVSWEIDIEDEEINSPEEAVEDCYNRIINSRVNDWIWKVEDLETGKTYEVDCADYYPPQVKELL